MKAELDKAWEICCACLTNLPPVSARAYLAIAEWTDAVHKYDPDATLQWCDGACTVNNIMVFLPLEVANES